MSTALNFYFKPLPKRKRASTFCDLMAIYHAVDNNDDNNNIMILKDNV